MNGIENFMYCKPIPYNHCKPIPYNRLCGGERDWTKRNSAPRGKFRLVENGLNVSRMTTSVEDNPGRLGPQIIQTFCFA
jgi:hypothetical protein